MKKSLIISSVVSLLLVFGACSSSKDEEIERLKAENEALRASVSQQTESSLTTSETTVVTTALLTESEATTTALSDEEQVQKLIENFTSHLSTFYKNVEVSYDSDTNYFIATASVKACSQQNTFMNGQILLTMLQRDMQRFAMQFQIIFPKQNLSFPCLAIRTVPKCLLLRGTQ